MLEEASVWVSDSEKGECEHDFGPYLTDVEAVVPYQWKDPLISRLQLRKVR